MALLVGATINTRQKISGGFTLAGLLILDVALIVDQVLNGTFSAVSRPFALIWAVICGGFAFLLGRVALLCLDELLSSNPLMGATWAGIGLAIFAVLTVGAAGLTVWFAAKFLPGRHHRMMIR